MLQHFGFSSKSLIIEKKIKKRTQLKDNKQKGGRDDAAEPWSSEQAAFQPQLQPGLCWLFKSQLLPAHCRETLILNTFWNWTSQKGLSDLVYTSTHAAQSSPHCWPRRGLDWFFSVLLFFQFINKSLVGQLTCFGNLFMDQWNSN